MTVDDPGDQVDIVSAGAQDEVSGAVGQARDQARDEVGIRAQLAVERRANARLRRLTAAASALSAAATPMQVAEVAVEQFGRMFGTTSVAVFELRGPDSLDAMALGGWAEGARAAWTTMPLDAPAPVADAARTRTPVWTESSRAWRETYPQLIGMLDGYGYTGVFGLPLLVAGETIGALGIGFTTERTLSGDEREDALVLANRCAHALQRAQLLQVEADARRSAEQLTAMVAALSRARTPPQVVAAITAAASAFGASAAVVAVRGTGNTLELYGPEPGGRGLGLDAAHPLAYAVRTGEPVWLARRSELAWQDRSFVAAPDAPEVDLAVPMLLDDATVGAIGMAFPGSPPHHSLDERRTILTLAGQGAQALDRARLHQAEHDIAETLQRSLLPDRLPELATVDLAARYLPAGQGTRAGGDWYDVIEVDEHRVAIVVGDVVGKGPAAAALMGQLRTAVAVSLLRGDGPAEAMGQLDRFAGRIPAARASSAVCVLLDHDTGRLSWANAGHPPPVLVASGEARLLWNAEPGPVLGLRTGGTTFGQDSLTLSPGATLALYSDGLVERRAERLDEGLARLVAGAQRAAAEPPAAMAATLLRELADSADPPDDIALVVARLMPRPLTGRRPAEANQLARIRRAVEAWAQAAALPDDQLADVQFGMGEALANAVDHAYRDQPPGELTYLLARVGDGSVTVEVADSGSWRPPPADPGHRGRGLQMIDAVGRDVDLRHGPTGTEIRFRVPPLADDATTAPEQQPVAVPELEPVADGVLRLPITGEVDLAVAAALRDDLVEGITAAAPGSTVEVDLRDATYIASAGVALLVHVADLARSRGHRVTALVEPHSAVARVLALTGVDSVLRYPPP
jgi:anti-anti-sigma factor